MNFYDKNGSNCIKNEKFLKKAGKKFSPQMCKDAEFFPHLKTSCHKMSLLWKKVWLSWVKLAKCQPGNMRLRVFFYSLTKVCISVPGIYIIFKAYIFKIICSALCREKLATNWFTQNIFCKFLTWNQFYFPSIFNN